MPVIRDRDGNVIRRSKNLAGIRRYVADRSAPAATAIEISPIGDQEGCLLILFDGGTSFETTFASMSVLRSWVRRWRTAKGIPLTVNGVPCGTVSPKNPSLA